LKRFFVLENNLLRWYKSEPVHQDWTTSSGLSPKNKEYSEILLTPDTSITVEDCQGGAMRTMTIRNTSKNVIIKVDEKQMDDTVLWFRELKRAIQQSQTSTYIIRFFDETLSLS